MSECDSCQLSLSSNGLCYTPCCISRSYGANPDEATEDRHVSSKAYQGKDRVMSELRGNSFGYCKERASKEPHKMNRHELENEVHYIRHQIKNKENFHEFIWSRVDKVEEFLLELDYERCENCGEYKSKYDFPPDPDVKICRKCGEEDVK